MDFDAHNIIENYDMILSYSKEYPNLSSVLSKEHKYMSRFFGTIWDSSGVDLLSWEDFIFGWTLLTCGNTNLALQYLFQVMDKNGDGLIIASDVIQFCFIVFAREKHNGNEIKHKHPVPQASIENLITDIFSFFGNGPFDPIDFSQFQEYSELFPETLFPKWAKILTYFSYANEEKITKKKESNK